MNRLRLGAVLHFIIAIGHVACLFALDEAFEAYGIRDIMHQMVSGHVWMLQARGYEVPSVEDSYACPRRHYSQPA